MKKLLLKQFITGLLLLTLNLFTNQASAKQPDFPIKELGSCRDAKECYYYCEIPENSPACWSYGKFVIENQVLGVNSEENSDKMAREKGITFPIAELGNCNSPRECMSYCNIPENQSACTEFARQKNLIKQGEGKQPPQTIDKQKIMAAAKEELGCSSEKECQSFCGKQENFTKCSDFASKNNLTRQEVKPSQEKSAETMSNAKNELGCDSEQSCMNFCNKPENFDKCQSFAKKHKIDPPEEEDNRDQNRDQQQPQINTNYQQESNERGPSPASFSSSPAMSPYPQRNGREQQMIQNPTGSQPSGFKRTSFSSSTASPIGCRTEQECNNYCKERPNECPGFYPQSSTRPQSDTLNQQRPMTNPMQNYSPSQSPRSISPIQTQSQENYYPSNYNPENRTPSPLPSTSSYQGNTNSDEYKR